MLSLLCGWGERALVPTVQVGADDFRACAGTLLSDDTMLCDMTPTLQWK